MKFKFLAIILTFVAAFSSIFAFSGCGEKTSDPIPTPPAEEDNSQPSAVTPSQVMDFATFIRDYKDSAVRLYQDTFEQDMKAGKNVLNETVSLNANDRDQIASLTAFYVNKTNDENRSVTLTTATLSSAINTEDVAEGKVFIGKASFTVKDETVFEFNAKENKENVELVQALKDALNTNGTMLYKEVESKFGNVRAFQTLTLNNDIATVTDINVIVNDKSDNNELLNRLSNSNYFSAEVNQTYKLAQNESSSVIYASEGYSLDNENFGTTIDPTNPGGEQKPGGEQGGEEKPPVESDQIQSVEDLLKEEYSAQVYQALNDTFLNRAGKQFASTNFTKDNILELKWDLGEQTDSLSQVKLAISYKYNNDFDLFSIGTIKFNSPIYVQNLNKENINQLIKEKLTGAEYKQDYSIMYNRAEQGNHDELAKAIFTACGHTLTEGSTILFVDGRYNTDGIGGIGEAHEFTVAEITDMGVQEYTIRVKEASTDQGYINNINEYKNNNTPGYFYLSEQKSQTLSENIVKEQAQENEVETTAYRYIVDFGDDERAEVFPPAVYFVR